MKLTVDGTSLGGGLTGLAGDVTANQTVSGLAGSFTAPAVSGTSATNVFSANWVEDQSVIGATPGSQASTASVTVNTFDHSADAEFAQCGLRRSGAVRRWRIKPRF